MTTVKQCERPCPVCGAATAEVVHHQDYVAPEEVFAASSADIVVCSSCGMCYADVPVVQAAIDVVYAEHSKYADTSIYADMSDDDAAPADDDPPAGAPWDLDRLEKTAAWLATVVPLDARVLDAGCATGALIGFLQAAGFRDIVGLDPSPAATAHVERAYGVRAITGSFMEPPDDIGQFDLVVLSHVLEHIADVQGAVAGMRSLTKPGGLVYIEVPDAARYHEYLVAPFHDFNTEHINHFSGGLLSRLMESGGFRVERTGTKTVLCSLTDEYPAVFGLYQPTSDRASTNGAAPDPALRAGIEQYVDRSHALMEQMSDHIHARAGHGPIVVWGAGQLTMKLLAGPLRDVQVAAVVDSSEDKWGGQLGQLRVVGPQQVRDDANAPVLVSSIHHQESIVDAVATAFPGREIITLR